MAAQIKQFFNIKFPVTDRNKYGHFIDLNETYSDEVLSEMLHVILTPKGQRIRMPNFGTDLIRFIFSQNDEISWGEVENEVKNAVSTYVPGAKVNEITVYQTTNEHDTIVKINYTVVEGMSEITKETYVRI